MKRRCIPQKSVTLLRDPFEPCQQKYSRNVGMDGVVRIGILKQVIFFLIQSKKGL